MDTFQGTEPLPEEGNSVRTGPLGNLDTLDLHLQSILASGALARIRDMQQNRHADASLSQDTPKTECEITVQVDDMDVGTQSTGSAPASHPHV